MIFATSTADMLFNSSSLYSFTLTLTHSLLNVIMVSVLSVLCEFFHDELLFQKGGLAGASFKSAFSVFSIDTYRSSFAFPLFPLNGYGMFFYCFMLCMILFYINRILHYKQIFPEYA